MRQDESFDVKILKSKIPQISFELENIENIDKIDKNKLNIYKKIIDSGNKEINQICKNSIEEISEDLFIKKNDIKRGDILLNKQQIEINKYFNDLKRTSGIVDNATQVKRIDQLKEIFKTFNLFQRSQLFKKKIVTEKILEKEKIENTCNYWKEEGKKLKKLIK